jgi:uncharacterized RDD family membrane protein YckC
MVNKAPIGKRVIAYILDSVILGVIVAVLMGGMMVLTMVSAMISDSLAGIMALLMFPVIGLIFLIMFGYLLLRDGIGGRSLGKKLVGLKVLQEGKQCTYVGSVKRNITMIVPLLNIVELIMPFVDAEGLRFGDKFAKTQVVEA